MRSGAAPRRASPLTTTARPSTVTERAPAAAMRLLMKHPPSAASSSSPPIGPRSCPPLSLGRSTRTLCSRIALSEVDVSWSCFTVTTKSAMSLSPKLCDRPHFLGHSESISGPSSAARLPHFGRGSRYVPTHVQAGTSANRVRSRPYREHGPGEAFLTSTIIGRGGGTDKGLRRRGTR